MDHQYKRTESQGVISGSNKLVVQIRDTAPVVGRFGKNALTGFQFGLVKNLAVAKPGGIGERRVGILGRDRVDDHGIGLIRHRRVGTAPINRFWNRSRVTTAHQDPDQYNQTICPVKLLHIRRINNT
ncbi:hypothetical protein D3C87_1758040 [compost metagenome]